MSFLLKTKKNESKISIFLLLLKIMMLKKRVKILEI